MIQLIINNIQVKAKIKSFKVILFDLITKKSGDEAIPYLTTPINSIILLKLV